MTSNHRKIAGSPLEIAKLYGLSTGTLANLRYQKRGPKYFKSGRRVCYFIEDVEAWLRRNPVLTTESMSK